MGNANSREKIIRMANQIASFFHSKPHDQGVEGIAEHINKFWEKRMRSELFDVMENEPQSLDPWVQEAMSVIINPASS